MAAWTQLSWNKVFYMLENGVESCKLDHNIIYIECSSSVNEDKIKRNSIKKMVKSIPPRQRSSNLDMTYLNQIIWRNKSLILSPSKKFYENLKSNLNEKSHFSKKYTQNKKSNPIQANASYYVNKNNANIGWSLFSADLNSDKFDDLIIGSPIYSDTNQYQNGAVFVVLNVNGSGIALEDLDLEEQADFIIRPPKDCTRSRFGHSVAVLDLNLDGFNDLVISAPSYNLENIIYEVNSI
jgi:glycosylphosphatidylinositol phospholipase D